MARAGATYDAVLASCRSAYAVASSARCAQAATADRSAGSLRRPSAQVPAATTTSTTTSATTGQRRRSGPGASRSTVTCRGPLSGRRPFCCR